MLPRAPAFQARPDALLAKSQPRKYATAQIAAPVNAIVGQSATTSVSVAGISLTNARVTWEVNGVEPGFGNGTNYVFMPIYNMTNWIEVEVQWPDGRRSFGTNSFYAAAGTNVVWIDDNLPPNATLASGGGDYWSWFWTTTNVYSGAYAHLSAPIAGPHSHYFTTPTPTMTVGSSDILYCWVWLDPINPPDEVELDWSDESGASHSAYWGNNDLNYGGSYMGPRPSLGTWTELTVPANTIGLGGHSLKGMSFDLYNGAAAWDIAGKTSP